MSNADTKSWSRKKLAESGEMWRNIAYDYDLLCKARKDRIAKLEEEVGP